MGAVVIGSQQSKLPLTFAAPIIELQASWGDGWAVNPQYELVSLRVNASSIEPSECTLTYRYGNNVKQVTDAGYSAYSPIDLSGYWVRISFAGEQGPSVQFVGQIDSQSRSLMGSDSNPAGQQTWVAVDGLRTLQKTVISQAVFYDPADDDSDEGGGDGTSTVGWVPAMNKRDERGLIVGNVSDADEGGNYFYGGTSPATDSTAKWTHTQYINYLIYNFIQQVDDDDNPTGPTWTLGGLTSVTDGLTTTIDFPQASSVAEQLKLLIDPKYGIDWYLIYTPDDGMGGEGFQITIFALTNQSASFGDATMPSNPNTVKINRTTQIDMDKTWIVQDESRKVDTVKVIGKRITVCGTLWGKTATPAPSTPTLVAKWSSALETDYISAGGSGVASTCDPIRRREKYRDVYQHLGAPFDWDLDDAAWAVATKADGTLNTGNSNDYQTLVRNTLAWIPLKQGYDYTANPPTDNTEGELEPETSAPLAWIYDSQPAIRTTAGYIQCELNGIGVGRPHLDWGIFLHATPNHRLALNSWTATQATSSAEYESLQFDYNTTVATIAIESDHRLAIEYDTPANLAAGDGSVMTILDEEAEMWVVLPGTIVDCDTSGNLVKIAGNSDGSPLIIRNDVDRLSLVMAGVIARYINQRAKARITFKTFQPWAYMVGSILDVFQQGDDVQQIGSVITSIEWKMGETPEMVISAGYA